MENPQITKNASNFWKNYSKRKNLSHHSLMNLQTNEIKSKQKFNFEADRLASLIDFNDITSIVDLGGGVGFWADFFSKRVENVVLVEREEEFIRVAKERIKNKRIKVVQSDVLDFDSPEKTFDAVFISGVTIYLSDEDLIKLMKKIDKYLVPGGIFIHRDAYGTKARFILDQKFSESLSSDYSAIYRTREEYDNCFVKQFRLKKILDEDMYPKSSELNKWSETRLRIAIYKK